jgi:1-acyl-sn-glycerol-3-phosphate acyltransferase
VTAASPWRSVRRWLLVPWTLVVFFPLVIVTTILWGFLAVALSLVDRRLGFYAGTIWAWCLVHASFVRVRVEGREHLRPGTSYVLLANHQGNYDILALYGFLGRQFRWVIKEELRKVPFLGWGCAAIGHIFVDRSDSRRALASLEAAKPRLAGGVSVVFFPEGTRSSDGTLGRFKKGGFVMARQLGLEIVPVAIAGSYAVLPKGCLFPQPGTLRVRLHPPLAASEHPDEAALVARVRDTIAAGLAAGCRLDDQPAAVKPNRFRDLRIPYT